MHRKFEKYANIFSEYAQYMQTYLTLKSLHSRKNFIKIQMKNKTCIKYNIKITLLHVII